MSNHSSFLLLSYWQFPPGSAYLWREDRALHPKFEFPGDWHITHSMKHWSNEETMLKYVEEIIVPYVEHTRQD